MTIQHIQERSVQNVALENLILDPKNPRLPPNVQNGKEEDFFEYLMKSADVLELMGSISSRGYFSGEPILVTKEDAPEGRYIVVEGNCRLTACKLLNNPGLAVKRKKSVAEIAEQAIYTVNELPCVVYKTRDEILDYLGYRHIKGAHSWDSLQKARYLDQLKIRYTSEYKGQELYKHLANSIGSGKRTDYVAQLLSTLNLYNQIDDNDFFDTGLNEGDINFSVLSTSLSYKPICKYLGLENSKDIEGHNLDIKRLENLTKWLFEKNKEGITRLGESRNLRSLSAVVEHEEALEQFIKGESLDEAKNWTTLPRENFIISVQESKAALRRALAVIHRVPKTSYDDIAELKEVGQLLKGLADQVKGKIPREDDDFGIL